MLYFIFCCLISLSFASGGPFDFEIDREQKLPHVSPCGNTGTLQQRVLSCSRFQGGRKGSFLLVTRTKWGKEIHLDTASGLLWGDHLHWDWRLTGEEEYHSRLFADFEKALNSCRGDLDENSDFLNLTWALPTISEWEEGISNGAALALPRMNAFFWSRSYEYQTHFAYIINGKTGVKQKVFMGEPFGVRCVAKLGVKRR